MTLVLKPKGRGNWRITTLLVDGDRVLPLLVRVGEVITLGGVVFRIHEVRP